MYRKLAVVVYELERVLGAAELLLDHAQNDIREIRISHYSPPTERCPPLAVLHTVNAAGICFKLESPANQDSPLSQLHASCLRDNKAAVTSIGGKEIHLVAMHSRKCEERGPCFWGFSVASSLYNSCLVMLNLRCLGIVFDLDETLIVANTMRSFEDKIDALQRKINSESDPLRVSGLWAEVKRYQDDKNMLKQYIETDQVIDNEKIIKSQSEVVPALSESHPSIVRPIIRLQERNIILTRINPLIRDTSVLVKLRPAWEDLRSYLIARGRKRFEVFVCTMAERDYALEMWRLLDPESHLINLRELLDRVVCVKSGSRKSLFNVFQIGNCHPKMALVIDDRLKVWDEADQPRVHVVPAFAPYHAPQAEANNSIPVLCVARNVACNVRGGFFKEFDDGLLQHITEVAYEDDIKDLPSSPDVNQYLIADADPSASNGKKDSLGFDGMADAALERKPKEAISSSSTSLPAFNLDPRISTVLQYMIPSSSFTIHPSTVQGPATSSANSQLPPAPSANLQLPPATSSASSQLPQATFSASSQLSQSAFSASSQLPHVSAPTKPAVAQLGQVETISHSSPGREEGEVPESELDPDTRRRLLILQHGQDMREPNNPPSETQPPDQPPLQVPGPRNQPPGWCPGEEEAGTRQLNQVPQSRGFPLPADSVPNDKIRIHRLPFSHRKDPSIPPRRVVHEGQRSLKEAVPRGEHSRLNQPQSSLHYFSANKYPDTEAGQIDPYTETCTEALHDIAFKCGAKVEFKQTLVSSSELQFFAEVLFAGERIGEAYGRTRREAQRQAAEGSLLYLADKYLSLLRPNSSLNPGHGSRLVTDANSFRYQSSPPEEGIPLSLSTSQPQILDPRIDASKKHMNPVSALRELCTTEGLRVVFQSQSRFSGNPGQRNETCVQVEINGEVLGKGIGLTWDEAKSEAAEKAIGAVKSKLGQFSHRHHGSPRSLQEIPNKKTKHDLSRGPPLHRIPSSHRYHRNGSPVP